MRVLITGAGGFVGGHLAAACAAEGDSVAGLGRSAAAPAGRAVERWIAADLADPAAAARAVREAAPERVFHLAARPSVRASWSDPRGTIDANVSSTVNLLEAVAAEAPGARVLVAGSAEQYGPPERLPLTEDAPPRPLNPYAVSKCAADIVAGFYADARGLHVVRARPFNHAGPGEGDRSVVADFARQIATAEAAGDALARVHHADTSARRDFTDVRDIALAYRLALEHAPPGAYNVCGGRATAVADILAALARLAGVPVEGFQDPALMREGEVAEIRGSHDKLTEATGWMPRIELERTIADTFAFWRARLRSGAAVPS